MPAAAAHITDHGGHGRDRARASPTFIIESANGKDHRHGQFHTGHRQLGYPGKCKFVHGHTWQGKVVVSADEFPRDDLDMSLEFGDIKNVMRFMDHKMLVTEQDRTFLDPALFEPEGVVLLKGKGPSVENVAAYVFDGVVDRDQEAIPRPRRPLHDRSDHPGNREQHLRRRERRHGLNRTLFIF